MRQLMSTLLAIAIIAIIASGFLFYIQGISWEFWWDEAVDSLRGITGDTEPPSGDEPVNAQYDLSFDKISRIEIDVISCETEVIGENRSDITVRYDGPGQFSAEADGPELLITEEFEKWQFNVGDAGILIVRVPQDLLPELVCDSVSGSLDLNNLETETLDVAAVSGRVNLLNSRAGSLSAHTVSGELNLLNCSFDEGSARTTSGSITFNTPEPFLSLQASSVSGDITCTIPDSPLYYIKARSVSGDVINNAPSSEDDEAEHRLLLSTTSGDIRIFNTP